MVPLPLPLFAAIPGGPELFTPLIIRVGLPLALAVYVYRDATERGVKRAPWVVSVFVCGVANLVAGLVTTGLYQVVREKLEKN